MSLGYTVTFNGNGGGAPSPASVLYTPPCTYGAFPAVSRDGYTLVGWFTAASGGTRVYATDAVSSANYTLYAQWTVSAWDRSADGEWVYCTTEAVETNLPAGLLAEYETWLDAAARAERLDVIVSGVVQDFRKAVDAANHSVGGADESLIPMACLRSALMMIWYFLGFDCGYAGLESLQGGWQDAEVYLRSLVIALRMGQNRFAEAGGATAAGDGLPRYTGSPVRASGGGSYSAGSSGGGSYSGGGSGYISLGL